MRPEFQVLINKTRFEAAAHSAGHKSTSAPWVYSSKKPNHLVEIILGKARLLTRGFMLRESLDYLDTLLSSIRMIANTALNRNWTLNYCDIEHTSV